MGEFDMPFGLDEPKQSKPDAFYNDMQELAGQESFDSNTGLLDIYPFEKSISPLMNQISENKAEYIKPEFQKEFNTNQLFLNTVLLFNSIPNKEPYGISFYARANLIKDTPGFLYFKSHFNPEKLEEYFKETDVILAELFEMPLMREYLISQFTVEGKRIVSTKQLEKDLGGRFSPPTYAQYFIKFFKDKYSGIKEETIPLGISYNGNISENLNKSTGRDHLNR